MPAMTPAAAARPHRRTTISRDATCRVSRKASSRRERSPSAAGEYLASLRRTRSAENVGNHNDSARRMIALHGPEALNPGVGLHSLAAQELDGPSSSGGG